MSLTVTQLEDRVYAQLRDEDRDFTKLPDVRAWLNDAAMDIAARAKVIRRGVTIEAAAGGIVTLPSDFIEAFTVRIGTDDLEFAADDTFWSWADSGVTPDHPLYRVFGGRLEIYPEVEEDTEVVVRYIASPALLVDDNDVSELPASWHSRLTYYALAQAWMQKSDAGASDRWLGRYEDGLPPLETGRQVFNGGPITLTGADGPFDLDPEARHL